MTASPVTDQLAAHIAARSAEHDTDCDCNEKQVSADLGRMLAAELPDTDAHAIGQVVLHLLRHMSMLADELLSEAEIKPEDAEIVAVLVNVTARAGHLLYTGGTA